MTGIRKTWGLIHKDSVTQMAVEKGVIHVKLTQMLPVNNRKSKNNTNSSHLDKRTEGVRKVKARNLTEPLSNEMSLVTFHSPIGPRFGAKKPPATYNISLGRTSNKSLRLIMIKSRHLGTHHFTPFRIT